MERAKIYQNSVNLGLVCSSGMVMLNIACRHCPRKGRYRVTRLIDQYTAAMGLPQLREIISSDCPKRREVSIYDRCGAYFPDRCPEPPPNRP